MTDQGMWTVTSTVDGELRTFLVDNEADARAGAAQMVAGGGHDNVRILSPKGKAVGFAADIKARTVWLAARAGQVS